MKNTLYKIIAIILIELIILLPISFAVSISIADVKSTNITDSTAQIKWNTNTTSSSRVNFGKSTLDDYQIDPGLTKNHSIFLTDLDESSTYKFEVVSRIGSDEVIGNNNGAYHTFTTPQDEDPIIEANIPKYYSDGTTFDLTIKTDSKSLVDVTSNGGLDRRRGYATDQGIFTISDLQLNDGYNTINIIATDPRDHTTEAEFEITVDTKKPKINLTATPVTTQEKTLSVNGTIDENVTLKITLTYNNPDTTPPAKVTGLRNITVTDNDVELDWNESIDEDFKEYVIYRNDKSISTRRRNDFADQVNTSSTYNYQISAVDTNCNEGEKSETITVTTLSGTINITVPIDEVTIECNNVDETIIQTNDTFITEFNLDEDGFYLLRVEAVDNANNTEVVERNIYLDTEPPGFSDFNPEDGTRIFEKFANEIEITGKTDPLATVHLFVRRTPIGELNDSIEIRGIPAEIRHLTEADLQADSSESTRADYTTQANEHGFFNFPMVDSVSSAVAGYRLNTVPLGDLNNNRRFDPRTQEMDTNLLFVATDAFGRRGAEKVTYNIQTCWSGDRIWSVNPLLKYQSPAFLSTERLSEGTETLYFYFNFTYLGNAETDKPEIDQIHIQEACDEYIINDPDYYHSCKVMRQTPKVEVIGNTAYVVYRLRRYDAMDNWTTSDWGSFFDSLTSSEMQFPLKFTVKYHYNNATGGRHPGTQTFCDSVAYFVDMGRIDPREVLPDWLLYDFVDVLDDIIDTTNDWMEKIDQILEYVALGCMISYFTKFFMKWNKNFQCKIAGIQSIQNIVGGFGGTPANDRCKQCITTYEGRPEDEAMAADMNSLSDTCLMECYPGCYSAWRLEETWYKFFRATCDRLFGHSAPAKWTEKEDNNKLTEEARLAQECTTDQSTQGRPLKAIDCRTLAKEYPGVNPLSLGVDKKCVEIIDSKGSIGSKAMYTVGRHVGNNVYQISKYGEKGAYTLDYQFAIKQNENSYLTFRAKTCAEFCELDTTNLKSATIEGNTIMVAPTNTQTNNDLNPSEAKAVICSTVQECKSFNKKKTDGKYEFKEGKKEIEIQFAEPAGYTRDCFYKADPGSLPVTSSVDLTELKVVSGDPKSRAECCCLNGQPDNGKPYYKPKDLESKESRGMPFESVQKASSYEDMVFSYRYDQINWESFESRTDGTTLRYEYHPDRYISGRDQTACFGMNHLLFKDQLALNPARDHFAAFQCADIGGILNRLSLINNLANMLKTCLLQVRTTGKADSGVCKELFTQYLCSFIWKIIVSVRDGCSPLGSLSEMESAGFSKYLVSGVSSLTESIRDTQNEVASEYGNADLNNIFGMGEEAIVRKACLAAFGYDWDISVDDFIDAAYATPYATFVQSVLPQREYLTFDPTNGKSVYEYKASWLINPGCEFDDYDVYLSCVGKNDLYDHDDIRCDKVGATDGHNCPCTFRDTPVEDRLLYDGKALSKNVLEDVDHTMIPSDNRIIRSKYRYDHLKIVIDARSLERDRADLERCFPEGHLEGSQGIFYFPIKDYTPSDLAACYVDTGSGAFDCSFGMSFLHPFGQSYIEEIELDPGDQVFDSEDLEQLNTPMEKKAIYFSSDNEKISGSVTYFKDNKLKCMVTKLLDKNKNPIERSNPIPLREGDEGSRTQPFSFNHRIEETEGSIYAINYIASYMDETGVVRTGDQNILNLEIVDNGFRVGGQPKTVYLEFIDKGSPGILLASESEDEFLIGTTKKSVGTDMCSTGECFLDLSIYYNDLPLKLKISQSNILGKKYTLTFSKSANPSRLPTEALYYVHVDLRNPDDDEGHDTCANVEIYDETIALHGTVKQSYDLPIIVKQGGRGNSCDHNVNLYSPCVCLSKKSTESAEGEPEDCPDGDFNVCADSGKCRKYAECKETGVISEFCVCGGDMGDVVNIPEKLNYYNCGFNIGSHVPDYKKPSYVPPGSPQELSQYKYCYAESVGEPVKCHATNPQGTVDASRTIVKVTSTDQGSGLKGQGTGFFINPVGYDQDYLYVMTAHHVAFHGYKVGDGARSKDEFNVIILPYDSLNRAGGYEFEVDRRREHTLMDYTVMKRQKSDLNYPSAKLNVRKDYNVGDELYALCIWDMENDQVKKRRGTITKKGISIQFEKKKDVNGDTNPMHLFKQNGILTNISAPPGCSGAPVFNKNDEVIGILIKGTEVIKKWGFTIDIPDFSFVIPIADMNI